MKFNHLFCTRKPKQIFLKHTQLLVMLLIQSMLFGLLEVRIKKVQLSSKKIPYSLQNWFNG